MRGDSVSGFQVCKLMSYHSEKLKKEHTKKRKKMDLAVWIFRFETFHFTCSDWKNDLVKDLEYGVNQNMR